MTIALLEVTKDKVADCEAETGCEEEAAVEGHNYQHERVGEGRREEVGESNDHLVFHGQVEVVPICTGFNFIGNRL